MDLWFHLGFWHFTMSDSMTFPPEAKLAAFSSFCISAACHKLVQSAVHRIFHISCESQKNHGSSFLIDQSPVVVVLKKWETCPSFLQFFSAFLAASESPEAPLAAKIACRKAKDLGETVKQPGSLGCRRNIPRTWEIHRKILQEHDTHR